MTHPNVALVREFYAERTRIVAAGECFDGLRAYLADGIVWHVPGRSAIAGEYRGIEEVMRYFDRRQAHADGSFEVVDRGAVGDDERVVHFAGGRARIGGQPREWETVGLFRIEDGRIAECRLVPFDQYAFDEIWS